MVETTKMSIRSGKYKENWCLHVIKYYLAKKENEMLINTIM